MSYLFFGNWWLQRCRQIWKLLAWTGQNARENGTSVREIQESHCQQETTCWLLPRKACDLAEIWKEGELVPPSSVTSWNTAGVSESGLSCFISQFGDCIPWHVVCLQEAFKRHENLEIPGGHVVYTPSHRPQRGFRAPEIYASGVRWVAVRVLSHAVLIISAHLPHARQSVMSFREMLQEITCCLERFKSAFPRHNVVLGADCIVSLNGFEDGRFVGDATVPLAESQIVCRR